ncbi:MAG: HYR domain-containing protein [Saprospirales bacterium]|nr:HYR domain-containing protein [Saprospirales bacterium]
MYLSQHAGIARPGLPAAWRAVSTFPVKYLFSKRLSVLFTCLWLGASQLLQAQCPPPGFPDPGNTCPLAPILCENLDGYCSTINNNNTVQSFPGCSGAWTLNNDEWFAFYAGTTSITIQVTPLNCSSGPMQGLQGGIYAACGPPWTVIDVQCVCTEEPFILSANNYTVGGVYWFVLDGCSGNVCDYRIDVLSGSTIGMPPADPGAISGPLAVCPEAGANYAIAPVNAATVYSWALTPALGTIYGGNSTEIWIDWNGIPGATAELCVTASNLCYANLKPSCITVKFKPVSKVLNLGPDRTVCTDSAATFNAGSGFVTYLWQDGSTDSIYTATTPGLYWVEVSDTCGITQRDSVFFTYSLLPDTQFPDVEICPGESVAYAAPGFNQYAWAPAAGLSCTACPGVTIAPAVTTEYTLLASDTLGCILRDTFTATVLPQPAIQQVLEFCPGASVLFNGITYTQPGTVTDTLPAAAGCDTVRTTVLQYLPLTQPSSVTLQCPPAISVSIPAGMPSENVAFDLPLAATDCPCGTTAVTQTLGLPSGAGFPVGNTQVCFVAADDCATTASCCFTVSVENDPAPPQGDPCDVKVTGCVKFEILGIFQNPVRQKTYRMRVTNTCTNKLIYAAFQLPGGLTAEQPANGAVYVSAGGRQYLVRNPNYSPLYSIRYAATGAGIAGGQSDIFEYTLPAQADPTFIGAVVRLEPQIFYETHLNVFDCPVQQTPDRPESAAGRTGADPVRARALLLFPNPATDKLDLDLSPWEGQRVQLRVFDALGRLHADVRVEAAPALYTLDLSAGWPEGLYTVVVLVERQDRYLARFVRGR